MYILQVDDFVPCREENSLASMFAVGGAAPLYFVGWYASLALVLDSEAVSFDDDDAASSQGLRELVADTWNKTTRSDVPYEYLCQLNVQAIYKRQYLTCSFKAGMP